MAHFKAHFKEGYRPGKVLSCYNYLKMVAGSGAGQGVCNPLMTPESPSSNTSQGGWEIYELLVKTILLWKVLKASFKLPLLVRFYLQFISVTPQVKLLWILQWIF